MPINVTMTIEPTAPNHGDTVTLTYAVTGNTGTPAEDVHVDGQVNIGGDRFDLNGTLTRPAVPPLVEEFIRPSSPGLTWESTADPHVWTTVIP